MRITISGFYGSENSGDEAILASIINTFQKNYESVQFSVLSLYPKQVTKEHNVEGIYRPNLGPKFLRTEFRKMINHIRNSDLLLIGGGGLIQDAHSQISILRNLYPAVIAKWLDTPVVYYAVGVGPIKNPVNRYLTRILTNLADKVTVRDSDSKKLLEDLGVSPSIEVTADPVFALEPSKALSRKEALLKYADINSTSHDRPIVGVSLREFNLTESSKVEMSKFLDLLANDSHILFIPFGYEGEKSDLEVSREVRNKMGNVENTTIVSKRPNPQDLMRIIDGTDIFVGMRLHSVIMALSLKKPVLGLSYLPKVESILHQAGYEEDEIIQDTSSITLENLTKKYGKIKQKRIDIKELKKMAVELPCILDEVRGESGEELKITTLYVSLCLVVISPIIILQEIYRHLRTSEIGTKTMN